MFFITQHILSCDRMNIMNENEWIESHSNSEIQILIPYENIPIFQANDY